MPATIATIKKAGAGGNYTAFAPALEALEAVTGDLELVITPDAVVGGGGLDVGDCPIFGAGDDRAFDNILIRPAQFKFNMAALGNADIPVLNGDVQVNYGGSDTRTVILRGFKVQDKFITSNNNHSGTLNVIIEDCWPNLTTNPDEGEIYIECAGAGTTNVTVRRSASVLTTDIPSSFVHLLAYGSGPVNLLLEDNFAHRSVAASGPTYGVHLRTEDPAAVITCIARRNMIFGFADGCFHTNNTSGGTDPGTIITSGGYGNISSDTTATAFGAVGAQINKSAASIVINPLSNWKRFLANAAAAGFL